MIGSCTIITEHLGGIAPHENRTGVTNPCREVQRILDGQLQVFRGNQVCNVGRFIQVGNLNQSALPMK